MISIVILNLLPIVVMENNEQKHTWRSLSSNLEQCVLVVSSGLMLIWMYWWFEHNPLPDGYQNEYLHIGNAFDLFGALREWDVWHLRWYMYTGYWPWGFYAAPWPLLWFTDFSVRALQWSNLIHLSVLGGAVYLVRRYCSGAALFSILMFCPAVFGSLVRYEPNLANLAWVALGLAALMRSDGLKRRRWVLLWGGALGIGLMMDRLTALFFLMPAIIPLFRSIKKSELINLILGGTTALVLSAAYYREFFNRHLMELTSQAATGEIDSAGAVEELINPAPYLYYVLSLVDSQAGPFIGLSMLVALGVLVHRRNMRLSDWILMSSVAGSVLFFTLITKKQAFYTIPILFPMAFWLSQHLLLRRLALVGGVLTWLSLGCGSGQVGGPWLPERWVAPRHTLAKAPSFQEWSFSKAFEDLDAQHVLVFSEDETFFEGFLQIFVRERLPHAQVRGLVLDPVGTHEFVDDFDLFVWIGPEKQEWPSVGGVQVQLISDHYILSELPPIDVVWSEQRASFEKEETLSLGDAMLRVYRRKRE